MYLSIRSRPTSYMNVYPVYCGSPIIGSDIQHPIQIQLQVL